MYFCFFLPTIPWPPDNLYLFILSAAISYITVRILEYYSTLTRQSAVHCLYVLYSIRPEGGEDRCRNQQEPFCLIWEGIIRSDMPTLPGGWRRREAQSCHIDSLSFSTYKVKSLDSYVQTILQSRLRNECQHENSVLGPVSTMWYGTVRDGMLILAFSLPITILVTILVGVPST